LTRDRALFGQLGSVNRVLVLCVCLIGVAFGFSLRVMIDVLAPIRPIERPRPTSIDETVKYLADRRATSRQQAADDLRGPAAERRAANGRPASGLGHERPRFTELPPMYRAHRSELWDLYSRFDRTDDFDAQFGLIPVRPLLVRPWGTDGRADSRANYLLEDPSHTIRRLAALNRAVRTELEDGDFAVVAVSSGPTFETFVGQQCTVLVDSRAMWSRSVALEHGYVFPGMLGKVKAPKDKDLSELNAIQIRQLGEIHAWRERQWEQLRRQFWVAANAALEDEEFSLLDSGELASVVVSNGEVRIIPRRRNSELEELIVRLKRLDERIAVRLREIME